MNSLIDRTALASFLGALLLIFAAGCNTTRGFGEDVEAAGEGVQNAAEEVEEELED